MVSLNELCELNGSQSNSLHQACALPRAPADMAPLPEAHAEIAFDSSWEALLAGTAAAENWGD